MNTSRVEAFSDGVFAVAITLLVLQFTVPEVASGRLLATVLSQWPQLVTYIASFLTVGVVWVNHHTIFRNLRAVDRTIQFINLVLLMMVVLLPYPHCAARPLLELGPERRGGGGLLCGGHDRNVDFLPVPGGMGAHASGAPPT